MPPDNPQPTIQPDQPRRVIAPTRTPTAESAGQVLRQEDVPTGTVLRSDTRTGTADVIDPAA